MNIPWPTVAIAMPPGKWPTQALAARNNSRLIPETLTSDPIRMNSGTTAKLVQYDAISPNRWIVHSGSGSLGAVYSADVDTASQLAARVAQDQPLAGGTSAGPAFVGLALGFAFGPVAPAARESVTVITRVQSSAPTGVSAPPAPPARAGIRFLSPVPFRSTLDAEIELPQNETVSLDVFDLTGRHVRTLRRGLTYAGKTPFRWDGRLESGASAPSGVYFLRLRGVEWTLRMIQRQPQDFPARRFRASGGWPRLSTRP